MRSTPTFCQATQFIDQHSFFARREQFRANLLAELRQKKNGLCVLHIEVEDRHLRRHEKLPLLTSDTAEISLID